MVSAFVMTYVHTVNPRLPWKRNYISTTENTIVNFITAGLMSCMSIGCRDLSLSSDDSLLVYQSIIKWRDTKVHVHLYLDTDLTIKIINISCFVIGTDRTHTWLHLRNQVANHIIIISCLKVQCHQTCVLTTD